MSSDRLRDTCKSLALYAAVSLPFVVGLSFLMDAPLAALPGAYISSPLRFLGLELIAGACLFCMAVGLACPWSPRCRRLGVIGFVGWGVLVDLAHANSIT